MSLNRVAITGFSSITSVGNGAEATWKALLSGTSGIAPITRFDTEKFRTKFAGEVKAFEAEEFIDPKQLRTMDYFIQYAMFCAREALLMSGLIETPDSRLPDEMQKGFAAIIGCGLGGLPTIEENKVIEQTRGPSRITPFFIPKLISNLAPGHIAIKYGMRGSNFAITSACSSGAHALGEAYRMIKFGMAERAIAGGTESVITPLCVGGFNSMRALSMRNEEPQKASRPWDKNRDGFVVGEGAGLMILEDMEKAQARGAKIFGELVGYSANDDAFHMTAPAEDGSGAAAVMSEAIADSGVSKEEVMYVNAHGTSTPLGDLAETKAIKAVFGDHSKKIKVSSTKSMIGHTLGAAGGIESVVTLQALIDQKIHPTINLDDQDPECDLDFTANKAADLSFEYALSNSFGFGGTNAGLVFRKVS